MRLVESFAWRMEGVFVVEIHAVFEGVCALGEDADGGFSVGSVDGDFDAVEMSCLNHGFCLWS